MRPSRPWTRSGKTGTSRQRRLRKLPHLCHGGGRRRDLPDETFRRLAAIKRQYDPGNLFARNHNVRPSSSPSDGGGDHGPRHGRPNPQHRLGRDPIRTRPQFRRRRGDQRGPRHETRNGTVRSRHLHRARRRSRHSREPRPLASDRRHLGGRARRRRRIPPARDPTPTVSPSKAASATTTSNATSSSQSIRRPTGRS